MRAQHDVLGRVHEKGVLDVARSVSLGQVEGFEVVPVGLQIGRLPDLGQRGLGQAVVFDHASLLRSSTSSTAAAAATFSDSTPPAIGIVTFRVTGTRSPCASAPNTSACARSTGAPASGSPDSATAPHTSRPVRSPADPPATRIRKTLPAEARTALGPKGSAVPSSTASAGAPAAAAVRAIAPTLPGSCTPSSTSSGQPLAWAAASASAKPAGVRWPIAITPWGVTVSLTLLNTRSLSTTVRRASTPTSSTPSRRASTSSSRPAAAASRTTRGPSSKTSPGSRRWPNRRRRRATSLSGLVMTAGLLEAVFRNLHQPGKGTAVAHGQVGEHFAVDLNPGRAKAVHELVVGLPRLPRRGVEPRAAARPQLALASATVAIGVGQSVQHRLVGGLEEELVRKAEALGAGQDRLMAAAGGDAPLDPRHLLNPQ